MMARYVRPQTRRILAFLSIKLC